IALLLIVRNVRYPWQLNGILFGAAVGAGFAGLESAGYAFRALFSPSGYSVFDSIMMRAILSPGGHVIWTAMIGSAIWKVKRDRQFEFSMLAHPVVIRRFLVAVVLHGLWDTDIISLHVAGFGVQYIALFIVGWVVMFGILKDALQELANAKSQLPSAPTPSLYVAETMIANPEKKVTQ
ncbi:MAG TPA: PrsW family glutamic-type intramembrane protease, partial [Planctomycetota bacterium]|nr:PrsW family glutamic-type intramembrane protease [Planctomycetota bacterium]